MSGTKISKGHRDYMLMYHMLTGIRMAVDQVSSLPDRALQPSDFSSIHHLTLTIQKDHPLDKGDRWTPGRKHEFKDYAPWVFRSIRQKSLIKTSDYLFSLTSKYILSELHTPGKSHQFLYYSRDYRYIIKTIQRSEYQYMRTMLQRYYEYISSHPNSLLCRYYGLHRIKSAFTGQKLYFVVMENVLPPNKDMHEIYDLKGSTQGRYLSEKERKSKKHTVLKDLNWLQQPERLCLGPTKWAAFKSQLEKDVQFLISIQVMDYSLMIGIHHLERGNRDNIRNSVLHQYQARQKMKGKDEQCIMTVPLLQTLDTSQLNKTSRCRMVTSNVFYGDKGGFRATDDQDQPMNRIYYFGIIDILTQYNLTKKAEHVFKSLMLMTTGHQHISAIAPSKYGQRFLNFIINPKNNSSIQNTKNDDG
ncbi:uncharacterized protein BX664DRAFT_291004 [Halteromyces radiatus]|uniref:uncharacterized protein n=1 Tax=Halteromyces radiatus TaxID=101107 RepID=UPI00221F897B|nr:uncharacterized protein BX664DRAFT_291004 [Halteromyces radiatus]KAI8096246.1 hypothetical protein BX664DRAFT_291004 [Halteromyces radiatus]